MHSTPEIKRIKFASTADAKTFLARKYHEEYTELYQAYLINRGITPQRSPRSVLVDEREILKEKEGK